MNVSLKLVGFNRETDELAVEYDIPSAKAPEALDIANPTHIERLGDIPLSKRMADQIAGLLGRRLESTGQDYLLEQSAEPAEQASAAGS